MKPDIQRKQSLEQENRSVQSLIDRFARYSRSTAILSFERDKAHRTKYRELLSLIRRLSTGLIDNGLEKGDTVIVLAANSVDSIVAALATIYAGGVCVPVDMQSSDEVLKHIIKDSKSSRIFADARGQERFHKLRAGKQLQLIGLAEQATHENTTQPGRRSTKSNGTSWKDLLAERKRPSHELAPDDLAVIFYTSGTTGMPKGVPLTHANLTHQIDAVLRIKLVRDTDRLLLPLPLFHVYPFVIGLLTPLALGLTVILPKSITGPEVIRAIKEGEASILVAVPRLLRALYTAIESKFREHKFTSALFDGAMNLTKLIYQCTRLNAGKLMFHPVHKQFPHLRLLACGGALLDPDLSRNLKTLGWGIAVGYGLSETSPLLTIRMPGNSDIESVGKPIPGVELRLQKIESNTDASDPSQVEAGGQENQTEIQARGQGVFRGYLNLPDKTKEAFTKDGWFRTGDLGFLKRGNLHIVGRSSTTLKSEGGKKIQPDEVEDSYSKNSAIREIGVLQSENKLVALIVPDLKAIGHDDPQKKIAAWLREKSSDLPSYYRLADFAITRQPLPRTNLGKIKRHELLERYEESKASEKATKGGKRAQESGAPKSPEDQALMQEPVAAECWKWLSEKFPDAQLDLDKSPTIDLNIDSFEWLNLSLEMRERLGVELNEDAIARIDTIRDLLKETVEAAQNGSAAVSIFEKPQQMLDENQKQWLKPLGPVMSSMSYLLYVSNYWLMRLLFRVSAEGEDQMAHKQVVFVANHASYLDAFALAAVIPFSTLRRTHWAGWAGIALANPFNTFIYRLAQAIPIEAKRSLFSSLALGAIVLKGHENLIWFPEGERTLDGKLLPFKPGIGMLLEHFPVDVEPIFIAGTREALPPGAFFPKFKKVTIRFGERVRSDKLTGEADGAGVPEQIAKTLQDRVQKLSRSRIKKNTDSGAINRKHDKAKSHKA